MAPVRALQHIRAANANARHAELLGIPPGQALLLITRDRLLRRWPCRRGLPTPGVVAIITISWPSCGAGSGDGERWLSMSAACPTLLAQDGSEKVQIVVNTTCASRPTTTPFSRRLASEICPPSEVTISWQIASPSPDPRFEKQLLENGSNR